MGKKTRGLVALAWLALGVSVSMKGENFLLRHRGYGMALGAAWTLVFLAISGETTADSELRTKRFHLLWFLGSVAIGALFVVTVFLTDFGDAVIGFVVVVVVVTCVKQAKLYRQASHIGYPKLVVIAPQARLNHG